MGYLVLMISLDLMKSSEVRTAGDQSNCGRVKCFLKITEKVFIWQVKNDAGGWLCHDFFKERVKKFGSFELVGEARGIGLIAALEIVKNKETKENFDPYGKVGKQIAETC